MNNPELIIPELIIPELIIPDLIIIGAGPAGLAAAIEATSHGLSVLVLDENAAPGGRIWQALERRGAEDADDDTALAILRAFRACPADIRGHAAVWAIEPDGTVFWSLDGIACSARARHILLATGTTERPVPIPGWTLPGVMTVGAAQIALKTGGLIPDQSSWLAGQGPLLLLYAVQALRAGGRLAGIVDLSEPGLLRRALPHVPAALRAPSDLIKGLRWRREIARAGVPVLRAARLRAEGAGGLDRIRFEQSGIVRTEAADTLLLHDGVIPLVQITRALGCLHTWNATQRCWQPATDPWGRTSVPNISVAGDGAGIGGALAAVQSGRIAALGIANELGRIGTATRDKAATAARAIQARHLAIRPLLDAAYPPLRLAVDDTTLVCRCEEVTAGQIRDAVPIGCLGLNQLKAYTRCGMGPCQGRMCAPVAARVLALARNVPVAAIEPLRTRFPTKPVTVGELAALEAAQPEPRHVAGGH
jgi:NADPH-dependent 2,4-dienoyl-CoA reductase/sulfur reductase-like enzyme